MLVLVEVPFGSSLARPSISDVSRAGEGPERCQWRFEAAGQRLTRDSIPTIVISGDGFDEELGR